MNPIVELLLKLKSELVSSKSRTIKRRKLALSNGASPLGGHPNTVTNDADLVGDVSPPNILAPCAKLNKREMLVLNR